MPHLHAPPSAPDRKPAPPPPPPPLTWRERSRVILISLAYAVIIGFVAAVGFHLMGERARSGRRPSDSAPWLRTIAVSGIAVVWLIILMQALFGRRTRLVQWVLNCLATRQSFRFHWTEEAMKEADEPPRGFPVVPPRDKTWTRPPPRPPKQQ